METSGSTIFRGEVGMIHVVTAENIASYRDAMEQAYRLRHDVFVDELGWSDLKREDGREIDQFDDSRAVHMLCIEGDRVLGYQRLLPARSETCCCPRSWNGASTMAFPRSSSR